MNSPWDLSSPEVLQFDKYLLFYDYLIDILCIRSNVILSDASMVLSTLKLPQLLQMNVHHLVVMTSHRHHIKTCDEKHGA